MREITRRVNVNLSQSFFRVTFRMMSNEVLVKAYLSALALCDLSIVTVTGGAPIRLALDKIERDWKVTSIIWCASIWRGKGLIEACEKAWRKAEINRSGHWFMIEPHRALSSVTLLAEFSGIAVRTDEEMRKIAGSAVATIEQQFADLQERGELSDLNRGFRDYRLSTEHPVSYNVWIARRKTEMIEAAARAARQADRYGFGLT